jgi:hypothetical protein
MPPPAAPLSARLLAIVTVLCSAASGTADTAEWLATGTADWNTPANWSGSAVPSASDTVSINNTGTAIIPAGTGASAACVTLGGGAGKNGALLVSGTLALGETNIAGCGALMLGEHALVTSGTVFLGDTGTLALAGGVLEAPKIERNHPMASAAIVFAGGTVRASDTGNYLYDFFRGLGTLATQPAGLRFDTGASDVFISSRLEGAGGLVKLGPGRLRLAISSLDACDGATRVEAGELSLSGTGAIGGAVMVATGASLVLNDISVARITGTLVNNGLLELGNDYSHYIHNLTVGALAGSGTLRMNINPGSYGDRLVILGNAAGSHTIEFSGRHSQPAPGSPPLPADALRDLVTVQGAHAAAFSGSFTWGDRTYTLRQQAGGALVLDDDNSVPWLTVDKIIRALPQNSGGATTAFNVSSNTVWTVQVAPLSSGTSAASDASWLAVSPAAGAAGATTVTLRAIETNTTGAPRHAGVTVSGGGITRAVIVTQRAAAAPGAAPSALANGDEFYFWRFNEDGSPAYSYERVFIQNAGTLTWDYVFVLPPDWSGGAVLQNGPLPSYPYEYEPTGDTATLIFRDRVWSLDFTSGTTGTFHRYACYDDGLNESAGVFILGKGFRLGGGGNNNTGGGTETGNNNPGANNTDGGGGGGAPSPLALVLLAALLALRAAKGCGGTWKRHPAVCPKPPAKKHRPNKNPSGWKPLPLSQAD